MSAFRLGSGSGSPIDNRPSSLFLVHLCPGTAGAKPGNRATARDSGAASVGPLVRLRVACVPRLEQRGPRLAAASRCFDPMNSSLLISSNRPPIKGWNPPELQKSPQLQLLKYVLCATQKDGASLTQCREEPGRVYFPSSPPLV